MFTQVELISPNELVTVLWLQHFPSIDRHSITPNQKVRLDVYDETFTVARVFTSLENLKDLPTKNRIATIIEWV